MNIYNISTHSKLGKIIGVSSPWNDNIETGKRLARNTKLQDIKLMYITKQRVWLI